jgi:hypothetical protein
MMLAAHLSSTVLSGAFGGGELAPPLAPLAQVLVAGLALAHLVWRPGDGWVNCVLWARAWVRMLWHGLGSSGLASAGSEQVFS